MGFIGGMARLSFITCHRIDLTTQSMILKNQIRLLESQIAERDANTLSQPTEAQFKYHWKDANGKEYNPTQTDCTGKTTYSKSNDDWFTNTSYKLDENNMNAKSDNEWQVEYAQAIKQYNVNNNERDSEALQLKNQEKSIQTKLNNIDIQLKALDAEEEVAKKLVDNNMKKTFGALG